MTKTHFFSTSVRSARVRLNRRAAWAAPVEVTSPSSRARCSKRAMPAAPWFRSGRSSVPDLPKIFTAAAARNVGFGTAAIRSAR